MGDNMTVEMLLTSAYGGQGGEGGGSSARDYELIDTDAVKVELTQGHTAYDTSRYPEGNYAKNYVETAGKSYARSTGGTFINVTWQTGTDKQAADATFADPLVSAGENALILLGNALVATELRDAGYGVYGTLLYKYISFENGRASATIRTASGMTTNQLYQIYRLSLKFVGSWDPANEAYTAEAEEWHNYAGYEVRLDTPHFSKVTNSIYYKLNHETLINKDNQRFLREGLDNQYSSADDIYYPTMDGDAEKSGNDVPEDRMNFLDNGSRFFARGTVNGVLVANAPKYTLEPGAAYILDCISFLNTNGAYRGINSYLIVAGYDPRNEAATPLTNPSRGASTTALAAARAISLGANGTTGVRLDVSGWSYYRPTGAAATEARYAPRIGIGSCTSACHVRWQMRKVLGSVLDF